MVEALSTGELQEQIAKLKEEIKDVIQAYVDKKPQTTTEVFLFLFEVAGELIEVVEAAQDITKGSDKEQIVCELLKYVYDEVNPNIPWVPEPIESKLEDWLFTHAIPAFIRYLVAKYNSLGHFKTTESEKEE